MNPLYFSSKISIWYYQNKRDLPWRKTKCAYNIWISEIILQQTRIDQGTSYYHRFIEQFPNIDILAEATEDEVLKIWQGLGYYSRARNLHFAARQITKDLNGVFPNNAKDLMKIKGIGDYTAAAIASIAFNEAVPAIDGNVYRILSRFFGIITPIDTTAGKKEIRELAQQHLDPIHPGDFNQALMEFGSQQCTPKKPDCNKCPLNKHCKAYLSESVDQLPVKLKKNKQRDRYFYYLYIEQNGCLYFNKRTTKDIWKNLFDFPLIECAQETSIVKLAASESWKSMLEDQAITIEFISKEHLHLLSHQRIHAWFIHISLKNDKILYSKFLKRDKRNTFELAVPKIIENYLIQQGFVS